MTVKNKRIGWKIPIGVDPKTGEFAGTDYETDIMQSIIILLSTRPGERLGRPDYGCDLMRFSFENIGSSLIKEITAEITATVKRWEDRIESLDVQAFHKEGEGKLIFRLRYVISETGIRSEAVYEFSNNG